MASSWSPAKRDALLDELVPPTSRSGEHVLSLEERIQQQRARATHLRAKALPVQASVILRCNVRAREIYERAVRLSGGWTAVAKAEGVDESAIRQRVDRANVYPNIAQAFAGLTPEALVDLADGITAYAEEKARLGRGR